jgi:hypothetical protein
MAKTEEIGQRMKIFKKTDERGERASVDQELTNAPVAWRALSTTRKHMKDGPSTEY